MYAIICTIHVIISTFYDNTLGIHDTTCTIYDMSSTVYDITFTICVTSHIGCISDITHSMFMTYGITHIVMTTQPFCKLTAMMSDITRTVSVSSHPLYQFYQTQCMDDITPTICMTSYALHRTSHPLYHITPLYV